MDWLCVVLGAVVLSIIKKDRLFEHAWRCFRVAHAPLVVMIGSLSPTEVPTVSPSSVPTKSPAPTFEPTFSAAPTKIYPECHSCGDAKYQLDGQPIPRMTAMVPPASISKSRVSKVGSHQKSALTFKISRTFLANATVNLSTRNPPALPQQRHRPRNLLLPRPSNQAKNTRVHRPRNLLLPHPSNQVAAKKAKLILVCSHCLEVVVDVAPRVACYSDSCYQMGLDLPIIIIITIHGRPSERASIDLSTAASSQPASQPLLTSEQRTALHACGTALRTAVSKITYELTYCKFVWLFFCCVRLLLAFRWWCNILLRLSRFVCCCQYIVARLGSIHFCVPAPPARDSTFYSIAKEFRVLVVSPATSRKKK